MKPKSIMLIAGEASGDTLAAELVDALREQLTAADTAYTPDQQPLRTGLEPRFFGAGGPRMAAAGVELAFNLTEHSIIGVPTLKGYLQARRRFNQLLQLAIARQPDVIIGVDYNYFNLRFAEAIRQYVDRRSGWFQTWKPKLVKYISPQVWASREGRAYRIARDYDLLLSIFPFEKDWYAKRVPKLRVGFVGHPLLDRINCPTSNAPKSDTLPLILLLPGSRKAEIKRHWPVMLGAVARISTKARFLTVVPNQELLDLLRHIGGDTQFVMAEMLHDSSSFETQIGGLAEALQRADVAIASTGTVTMECAFFGVPAVTLYKTSWATYQLGKRVVKIKSLTMPNLLAGEEVFPEFIQNEATPDKISRAALDLLQNEPRRAEIKAKLSKIVASLGGPGASQRAAQAITQLLEPHRSINAGKNQKLAVNLAH